MTTQASDGRPVGVTANSFASVSMDPPLVLWSIGQSSRSFDIFSACRHFTVNILSSEQIEISQRFASRSDDKFGAIGWSAGTLGSPVLDGVIAYLECETQAIHAGGDHVILIGRVRRFVRNAGAALIYAQGRYAIAEDHPQTVQPTTTPSAAQPREIFPAFNHMRFTTALSLAGMALSKAADDLRQEKGLDLPQGRILAALQGDARLSIDQLVSHAFLTRQAAEDALASLAKHGYVTALNGDYSLTANGQALFSTLRDSFGKFEAQQLAGIPDASVAAARDVLKPLLLRLRPTC